MCPLKRSSDTVASGDTSARTRTTYAAANAQRRSVATPPSTSVDARDVGGPGQSQRGEAGEDDGVGVPLEQTFRACHDGQRRTRVFKL